MIKYSIVLLGAMVSSLSYANNVPSSCHYKSEICVEGAGTREFDGVPVYQSCWKWAQTYTCPDWSTFKNSCDNVTNCTETSQPSFVDPFHKSVNYRCETHTVEKKCDQYEEKKTCTGSTDYANGNESFTPTQTKNFSKDMSYMQMLDAINKDITGVNPLEIFQGKAMHCSKPKSLGPFTKNCCDIDVSDRGKWYQNNCKDYELKLGLARRNKDTHYIGEWCSNHKIYPIGCIEWTQGYCTFASMMGRIIQEQGRQQINELATKGSAEHNSLTQSLAWNFEDKQPHWNKATINGVEVASFTYQEFSQQNAPVWASFTAPVKVDNGSNAVVGSASISTNCKSGLCDINLTSMGQTQNAQFDPTCNKIALSQWGIGAATISQGQCVPVGSTPIGWDNLTWYNNNPSFWVFNVSSSTPEYLSDAAINWSINHKNVTGNGNCTATGCSYKLNVDDNGHTESGDLSFPYNCNQNTNKTTIAGITFAPKCVPQYEIIAVCTNGVGCGALPSDVTADMQSKNGWSFFNMGMSQSTQKFLTRNVAVKGTCQSNNCIWDITSLGQDGYQDVVTSPLQFNLFSAPVDKNGHATPNYTPEMSAMYTTGGFTVRPYQYSHDQVIGNTIKMLYRTAASGTWQSLNIPVDITEDKPYELSKTPTLKIWGKCDTKMGLCKYNVAQSITITAMPWGEPKSPQCEGFTPAELQLIDFSKIDLSEYTGYMQREFGGQAQNQIRNQTQQSAQSFQNQFNSGGGIQNNQPNGEQVVTVSPTSGTGGSAANPFAVTLWAASNFPKYYPHGVCGFSSQNMNTNPVSSISVNWGDGSPVDHVNVTTNETKNNQLKQSGSGYCDYTIPVFVAHHTYGTPTDNKTQTVPITVTLNTKQNGQQVTTVTVQNEWESGNENTQGTNGTINNTGSTQANRLPNAGTFNPKEIAGIQTNWQ